MKRISYTASAISLVFAAMTAAETVDRIVATVDTEVILYSELLDEVQPLLQEIRSTTQSEEDYLRERDRVILEVLDQAIERKLLYREAVLNGVQIRDDEVEERLQKIMENYESPQAFRTAMEQAGETMSGFRDELRKQILAITMGMSKRRQLEEQVSISESEARQYYEDRRDTFSRPERVKVRRIFLAAGDDEAARAQARARLDALADEVRLGADFAELARAHSEGPEAADGGLLGWVSRGELVVDLEEVIFRMEPGSLSPPVGTQFGYHLLLVEEFQAAGQASFEEVRMEIEPALRAQAAGELYKKWIAELRQRRSVRVLI
jgi:parvulin-like peptidyl-prolyl isomerase